MRNIAESYFAGAGAVGKGFLFSALGAGAGVCTGVTAGGFGWIWRTGPELGAGFDPVLGVADWVFGTVALLLSDPVVGALEGCAGSIGAALDFRANSLCKFREEL